MYNNNLKFASPALELDQPVSIHAVSHRAAFYIDHYAAAYIILKHDQERGRVSSEIQEIIDNGQFDLFARLGELPGDYHDVQTAFIVLNLWGVPAIRMTNTYLHISTEFTTMTSAAPIDEMTKNEPAVCIPAKHIPQLFKPAYRTTDELIDEFKSAVGAALPEDFDYWRNICCLAGTRLVYE